MRPIPKTMREDMAGDPFYERCALFVLGCCEGGVQWHHVFIYGGSQINEIWAILPACEYHHDQVKKDKEIKDAFERISLARATEEDMKKYPNTNWKQLITYLSQ